MVSCITCSCITSTKFVIDVNIIEVAHDNAASVKNYIVGDLKLANSYDTWHGKSDQYLLVILISKCRYQECS